MTMTQPLISEKYDVRFQPATWAFSIWGIIFILLSVYAIGQVLSDEAVPDRNNNLLVNKIKWYYSANLVAAGAWGFIFQADTVATYWIAELVIIAMLISAIYILYLSHQ